MEDIYSSGSEEDESSSDAEKKGGKKVLPKNKCPKLMPPISTLLVSEPLT